MQDTTGDAPASPSHGGAAVGPADIVLWLDLAEANQQDAVSVRESAPPGAEILRLTEQGVTPCPEGTPTRWRSVLDGIDRLVRRARELERRSSGCRYWVTGRAGLPAFFHLGHRLGKMAAVTFVHQPRSGGAAVSLPLDAQGPGGPGGGGPAAPFFARSPWPIPRTEAVAPVGLVVSSRQNVADSSIQDAFARQQKRPAAIVRGHAEAWLDPGALPVAMHELDELIRETCAAHPARETLAVFIAGPSSLAFLVGNAINPRVCRDVQVFEFDGARYTLAYELPYPPVPERNTALWLGASPVGTTQLALDEEIRAIQLAQGPGSARLAIVPIPAAQPMDLLRELKRRAPGVVQFSGHGAAGGLTFQDDHGQRRPVEAADLVELFRLAGDPVRLVVIAACGSDSYAEALLAHVDCVISMRGGIDDTDARWFAAALYRSLAEGDTVQVAFDHALLTMRLERPGSAAAPAAAAEAPRLRERDPGCSAGALYLVRRP
jgi:hypothetical protein